MDTGKHAEHEEGSSEASEQAGPGSLVDHVTPEEYARSRPTRPAGTTNNLVDSMTAEEYARSRPAPTDPPGVKESERVDREDI